MTQKKLKQYSLNWTIERTTCSIVKMTRKISVTNAIPRSNCLSSGAALWISSMKRAEESGWKGWQGLGREDERREGAWREAGRGQEGGAGGKGKRARERPDKRDETRDGL